MTRPRHDCGDDRRPGWALGLVIVAPLLTLAALAGLALT